MSDTVADAFRRGAAQFERGGSELYARLARGYADDPLVTEVAGHHEPRWEVPFRLFAGVHYLALAGLVENPWTAFRRVLEDHRDWLARWVREQPIQTNEVQRCWGLLPGFLTVAAGRAIDLVELGASGGLHLAWDKFRYRYANGTWGPRESQLELAGEAVGGPPATLFASGVEVRQRVGIDLSPVDVSTEHGARLLQAFVWPDQAERLARLSCAIDVARRASPVLVQGDYVELLPAILESRDESVLTVVFRSTSVGYLSREARGQLADTIAEAGAKGSVAWVSYEYPDDEPTGFERFALHAQLFPGERRRLARLDGHGNRLEWLGPA